jgi:regulator of protease activity HflC (stomatin/prohibitin superfamily)
MKISQIATLVIVVIGSYVVMSSVYTVNEVEQMIITQFGKPVGEPVTTAGLKFKVPFVANQGQTVHLGRPVRALAYHRPVAVFSAAT